jgi:hypothetical protein
MTMAKCPRRLREGLSKFKKHVLLFLWNFWPPFRGAGIRIKRVSDDYLAVDVVMKMRWWNRNYVGSHFGGSLYAMTDPFYMFMLIQLMGPEYIVWDKAASIRFKKPGRGTVRCEFRLNQNQVDEYREALKTREKIEPTLVATVLNEKNEVVAEVEKLLYIRRKDSVKK